MQAHDIGLIGLAVMGQNMASWGGGRRAASDSLAGDECIVRVLRRLPERPFTCQSDSGSAKLFRRPHLPEDGSGRNLPHRVEKQRKISEGLKPA